MLRKRVISLFVVFCMLTGLFTVPPADAASTIDAIFWTDTMKVNVFLKVKETTEVHAVLWEYNTAPAGLPSSAVKLEVNSSENMFAGTLNMPDKVGLYEVYYTTNGGTAWSMVFNPWGSYIAVPGVGVERNHVTMDVREITSSNQIMLQYYNTRVMGDVKGVIRPLGQAAPASGEMPADAFTYSKISTIDMHNQPIDLYKGTFTVPATDGFYVIYSTLNSGAVWSGDTWRDTPNIRVIDGKLAAYSKYELSEQWDEYGFSAYAELDGNTVTAYGGSGIPTFGDYEMSMVNDYNQETIETKACTEIIGEVDGWSLTGRNYKAVFELPAAEGFYKIYLHAWGLETLADKAFWVDETGKVTVVELKGINSSLAEHVRVFPDGMSQEEIDKETDKVNAGWASAVPHIDLTEEVLYFANLDYSQMSYSFDGGKKWTDKKAKWEFISKALNSKTGLELWVADKKLEKGNPPEDATIYKFPKVAPRPAKLKLSVNYQALYLGSGAEPYLNKLTQQTFWAVTKPKNDTVLVDGYEITLDWDGDYQRDRWYTMPSSGVAVQPLLVTINDKGYRVKVDKNNYHVRLAPVKNSDGSYTAASQPQKLTAQGLQKPPTVKPNYSKEIIKPPKGTSYIFGNKQGTGNGKTTISLEESAGEDFVYRKMPTRKKPASVSVTLNTAPKASFDAQDVEINKGKIVADSELQFKYGNGKWGKFKAPKGPQNSAILVRTKPKAKSKLSVEYDETLATNARLNESETTQDVELASDVFAFTYEWGEYEESGKTSNGVVDFNFVPMS